LQGTYYNKVLGAYAGAGPQRGWGVDFSDVPRTEGIQVHENQLTAASGLAWNGKGADLHLTLDGGSMSLDGGIESPKIGARGKKATAYGAFAAAGRSTTIEATVDVKPFLNRIQEAIKEIVTKVEKVFTDPPKSESP
jgi:hypothetical protein